MKFRLIVKVLVLLVWFVLDPNAGKAGPIINDHGQIQQLCVRFDEANGVAWYKGTLHTTLHERENDLATVVIDSLLGIEHDDSERRLFENQCRRYDYDRGRYTVAMIIDNNVEKFHGSASLKPWVDIKN